MSNPSDYPYFALMNGNALCGAVLIAPNFVLTAAHCVGADDDFQIGVTENIGVAGAVATWWDSLLSNWKSSTSSSSTTTTTSSSSRSGSGTEYAYKTKIVHPDYADDELNNDIAIYELENAVPDTVPYVKLRRQALTSTDAGTPLTVIGFGDTAASEWVTSTSNTLQKVTVSYVPEQACRQQLGGGVIGPGMLCAFANGGDSCGGDSGGPLVLEGRGSSGGDEDVLVGLVSWGVECADDNYPGVYARISHYYDWIVDSMCAMNPGGVPDGVDCGSNDNAPVSSPVSPVQAVDDDDDDDDWAYADDSIPVDDWTYADDSIAFDDDFGDNDGGDDDAFFQSFLDDVIDWVFTVFDI